MKVYTPIGSKERFLEMFQGVTKMKLNEDVGSMKDNSFILEAFDKLVAGSLKIEQINNQVNGDETIVDVAGSDENGNKAVFKFRVQSDITDQENVNVIQDAPQLLSFHGDFPNGAMSINADERANEIVDINTNRKQDMIDAVSEFVDFEDNTNTDDALYQEAVSLIDKVPYKKGTETIQTNKAYADEKPTNPEIRVHSPELQKYLSELQDFEESDELDKFVQEDLNSLIHTPGSAGEAPLYPQAAEIGVTNQYMLRKFLWSDIGVELLNIVPNGAGKYKLIFRFEGKMYEKTINKDYGSVSKVIKDIKKMLDGNMTNEMEDFDDNDEENVLAMPPDFSSDDIPQNADDDGSVGDPFDNVETSDDTEEQISPEESSAIHQAYENLVNSGNQTPTYNEISREANKILGVQAPPKTRTIPKGAEEFWEGDSHIIKNINADDVVKQGFENILPEDKKRQLIFKASEIVDDTLGQLKAKLPKERYYSEVKKVAVELYKNNSLSRNEEVEKGDYPDQMGKKFKPKNQMPKKKKKPQSVVKLKEDDDIEKLEIDKEETGDMIAGGLADDNKPQDFDSEQLAMGLKVEMEHTDNPMIALEIAMDHLTEFSDYYTRLDKMEKDAKSGTKSEGMMDNTPEEEELTDELLGYKPHNVGDYTDEEFDYAAAEREFHDKEDMRQNPEDYQGDKEAGEEKEDVFGRMGDIFRPDVNEDDEMNDYQGDIGDRFQDGEGNQFTVRNKVDGGVTLQGQGGEKEIATPDIQFLKKLSENETTEKKIITEEQLKIAKQTIGKRGDNTGMTKKEAVEILIRHNIK